MKRILAFNGSPRRSGNTEFLLESLLQGASRNSSQIETVRSHDLDLKYCTGCLRCNILKRCSLRDDPWEEVSGKIESADILVFAAPVYFHHLPGPLKIMLDRFRSFVHVQMTEKGLNHTPHVPWNKDFVLILCMGSSNAEDADPIIQLFEFITSILGPENRLHVITATRLGVTKQIVKSEEELRELYEKIKLPADLAVEDHSKNKGSLEACRELGERLSR